MVGIEKYKDYESNQSGMSRNDQDFLSLFDLFGSRYARNRRDVVLTGLGIRMQDIFNAAQKGYKQARAERNRTVLEMKAVLPDSVCSSDMDRRNQENIARAGLGIRTSRDIFEAAQKGYEQARAERNRIVPGSKVVPPDSVCSLDVDRRN